MINIVAVTKKAFISTFGRSALTLQKNAPTILMGVGVVGTVAATVMACKATYKLDSVKAETQKDIDRIHNANKTIAKDVYTDEDYKHDLVIAYTRRAISYAKLYGPSAVVGAISIGCMIGSHYILNKRNAAIVAAYKLVDESFKAYRQRVVEEFGQEKDKIFRYNLHEEETVETSTNGDGKKVKTKKTELSYQDKMHSEYAVFFDESSPAWKRDPVMNKFFLRCQQNYANDLLRSRGHIFLNEVYDMLCVPRTQAGSIVGWVRGYGDDFVDFGMYDGATSKGRDFINGYEESVLLDFNVDGVIYDMI